LSDLSCGATACEVRLVADEFRNRGVEGRDVVEVRFIESQIHRVGEFAGGTD
jgi:hypothetical protein